MFSALLMLLQRNDSRRVSVILQKEVRPSYLRVSHWGERDSIAGLWEDSKRFACFLSSKGHFLKIPKPVDSQFLLAWSRSTTKIHSKILKIDRYHRGFCFAKYYHPVYWGSKLKIRKPFDFTLVTLTSYVKSRLCEKVQQVSTILCVWVNLVGLFGF